MKLACMILGILGLLLGVAIGASAKSAVHEIEAGIGFLILAVSLGAYGIIGAVERVGAEQIIVLRRIAGMSEAWTCPKCQGQNPLGFASCNRCGQKL
jgi:hydrogenase/urease accessory protein HupE